MRWILEPEQTPQAVDVGPFLAIQPAVPELGVRSAAQTLHGAAGHVKVLHLERAPGDAAGERHESLAASSPRETEHSSGELGLCTAGTSHRSQDRFG